MKVQTLPITNLKVQPPSPAVSSSRGSLPLQELQKADIFFSSQSIRAHLSEVLTNKPGFSGMLVKMFPFTPPASPWTPLAKPDLSALIIEKSMPSQEEGAALSEVSNTSKEDLKPVASSSFLKAQWVDYSTAFKPDLLLRVYQLPFAKPTLKSDFIENRVAYIEKTGALLSGPQIQQGGIVETYRPNLERFLQWVNRYIPQGKFFQQFLNISQNGVVRLFNRWEFNGVRSYRDAAGNRVQFHDMARLPNNMIVEIKDKKILAEANPLDVTAKKVFKEKVLTSIEQAEAKGYQLLQENPQSGSQSQVAAAVEKPLRPVINPFMTNPFTVKASQSFIPTQVANIAPTEEPPTANA